MNRDPCLEITWEKNHFGVGWGGVKAHKHSGKAFKLILLQDADCQKGEAVCTPLKKTDCILRLFMCH